MKRKRYVFDSFAIIAFYENENGADKVQGALEECIRGEAEGWMSVINWGEVFYATAKFKGWESAYAIIQRLERYPISIVEADRDLTWETAQLKAKYPIAYADCFALALAKQKKAALFTGYPEFRKVKEEKVELIWLGSDG